MAYLRPHVSRDEDSPEKLMKDVACVVFFQNDERDGYYIYLIDVTTQKLKGFLKLDENEYPSWMGCIVYKSMLYMFGGIVRESSKCHKCSDAYVLDLYELGNTAVSLDNEMKPKPTKLPQMNSGKSFPIAVAVGHLICVFDGFIRARDPPHFHFEVYDPKQKSWDKIQDPSGLRPGNVRAYYVKDNKIFFAIRNNEDIHILDFNGPSSPTWSHVRGGTTIYPDVVDKMSIGVKYGLLLVCLTVAYNFADGNGFGCPVCDVVYTGKTGNEGLDVVRELPGGMLCFGSDKVCTITPQLVKKARRRKRNLARLMIAHRKPLFLGKERDLPKPRPRKISLRFVVNVCSVDINARPIELEVLKSFTIPMYASIDVVEFGFVMMASLCNP